MRRSLTSNVGLLGLENCRETGRLALPVSPEQSKKTQSTHVDTQNPRRSISNV